MNHMTSTSRSRWLVRLSAPLAGLALLGAGVGAAQAHDFDRHDRSTVNVHRHLPIRHDHNYYRDYDRRNYGQYRHHRYHRNDRYGWRGARHHHDRRDYRRYRAHRYARDDGHDNNRSLFGRW